MAFIMTVLSTCVALQLSTHPKGVLLADRKVEADSFKVNHTRKAEVVSKVEMTMVMGCGRTPGAGMNPDLGFTTIYKDGYFHVRCMMDEMFKIANYHDELTRVHEYKASFVNVSIVKYADRVDVEKQVKMTPRVCFDFCRTIPDMSQFGLVYGRECYCTPYYHQIPGDGVCSSPCEGDNTVTCGNQDGMADVYEMHTCGDTVQEAEQDVSDMTEMLEEAHALAENGTFILMGIDESVKTINVEEIRHPVMNASRVLAALIRPLKEAIGKGESSKTHLDDYIATVSVGTTNAHQVLRIEKLQDHVNDAANEIKETSDALHAWLDEMTTSAAFAAAGLEKTAVQDLGESLQNYMMLYEIDPVPEGDVEMLREYMGCPGNSWLDCDKQMTYWISLKGMTRCSEVNDRGYFSSYEYGPNALSGMTTTELQEELLVTCAEMCKGVELCHAFYAYISTVERRDSYDPYLYQYCGFYTVPDTSDCASTYHWIGTREEYSYGPASYYYSYWYYYYSYYYDCEAGTGYGGGELRQFSYYHMYDYSYKSMYHFALKKDLKDCIGPVTSTNVDGVTTGFF